MKQIFFFILLLCVHKSIYAQASYPVTDSLPITENGLQIGYNIVNKSEKEVGKKGNFSRYVVSFYVTNVSNEAKIILHKPGWTLNNDVSANLVQFNCLNATGARLTAKGATIQAKQYKVFTSVEQRNHNNNSPIQNQQLVDMGYWIKAGETITNKQILIVPLNETPMIRATVLLNTNSYVQPVQNMPAANTQLFYQIKNFQNNTYLNNQYGPVTCSNIDKDWWSAQWRLQPVNGTNYYIIVNRWKSIFINDETTDMSSMNSQSVNSMWILEPIGNSNTYKIKSVADNTYLNIETGNLQSSLIQDDALSARWILVPM